ncbi:MAG: hypothetical protein ACI4AK_05455 [Lepagella sp.]
MSSCNKDDSPESPSIETPSGPRDPFNNNPNSGGNNSNDSNDEDNDDNTGGDYGAGDSDEEDGESDGVAAQIVGTWRSDDLICQFTFEKSGELYGYDSTGDFSGFWSFDTLHKMIQLQKNYGKEIYSVKYKCVVTDEVMTLYGADGERISLTKIE